MKARKAESCYWDDIADRWHHTYQQKILRYISDVLNARLFAAWLPADKVGSLLKTDLFDESLTDGLYPLLARHAEKVTGIDISNDIVAAVKKRHPQLDAVKTDVREMPFDSESFDVIVSNSTLDHFETPGDIVTSLLELKRVLKKGGQLLVTLDNFTNPTIFVRNLLPNQLLNRLGLVPYYVGATFGARRLKQVLKELGFTTVEVRLFWHCPRIAMVLIARIVNRYFSNAQEQRFIKTILSCECLSHLPTRHLTGQFVAAKAIKD